ncbi:hypothetical protein JOF28_001968 [Leucobacter exalbidus]|uniref:Uncharacterized protein n=1 Tax=Leucobacter exalbidus TaxID=662960 RepID=A0A940PX42_9MICO|nr:hypothetical protein [Leucobacter exalbidus]MBP1326736.1 hypothetical protein [Leucobacter exalbidus]
MSVIVSSTAFDTPPVAPILVEGWETSRAARNVVHERLFNADPIVSIRPATTRKGTLRYLFATASAAQACFEMHAAQAVFTVTTTISDELPVTLRYVATDEVKQLLDPETSLVTIIEIPYREAPQ